jgi:penicillin-binding protein 2
MFKYFKKRRRPKERELNPDDIFLDSSNLPDFDHERLEGRLERPVSRTAFFGISATLLVLLVVLFVQAGNLELVKGAAYAKQSEKNRLRPEVIFAERGAITDRNGVSLAWNVPGEDGYPERKYLSPGFGHILGYVSYPEKDKAGNYYETVIDGMAGIERAFNERLAGANGTLLIEEDARGTIESQGSIVAAKNGETLPLSIDARVQQAFASSIKELADKIPYKGGAGILMDVETGEIIALASYPEYDPNVLSSGADRAAIVAYNSDPREPYLDRPVAGLYTPGSIVKPMIAAGVFNDGIISPETVIVSTGSISVPNPYDPANPTIFKDWKALGAMNMRSAVAYSSDVYFYTVGGGFGGQKGLGIDRLDYWYKAFGFTKKTGIEIENENSGFIPTPAWKEETYGEPWRIGNTYHTAIGQYAVQITPLEAVRAIAAVANGGKLMKPTLLKGAPIQGESIAINQEGLQIAREGMRMGVTEGTSVGLNPLSYVQAAGKTGTAQLGFHNEFYNTWAVGFFPYDKPKYAYAVVMEKGPAGTAIGGIYVMSQVFTKLRQSAPEYFGLAPLAVAN